MQPNFMFTSESVTDGHPDKLCDQISDSVVGHYLRQDPHARVVAECAMSTGLVFLSVKYRSDATVDVAEAARSLIRGVGYRERRFNADSCSIMTSFHELHDTVQRASDVAGLDEDELDCVGAEDHATVFGFACRHTATMMPLPLWLAHRLARRLSETRASGALDYLAPDGKVQVGVEFVDHEPRRIHSVTLVAAQRFESGPRPARLRDDLVQAVIEPTFEVEPIRPDARTSIAINPEGPFVEGGPAFHAGLTGRKNAIDTYGGFARHGSAALSGKDMCRIDRTAAYAARHAAKNVVKAGLAAQCEVGLSYAVGVAQPVSVQVETYGTGTAPEQEIAERIARAFDLRAAGIVRRFALRRLPFLAGGHLLSRLAVFGQVGRSDLPLAWESTDEAEALL